MAKRRQRVGHGDRVRKWIVGGDPMWRSVARMLVLKEVDRIAPSVWPELRADADPACDRGNELGMRRAVNAWCARHGFPAWVAEYAIDRLQREPSEARLASQPELARRVSLFGWRPAETNKVRVPVPPRPIAPLEWNPARESLADFEERVRDHVDDVLAWLRDRAVPSKLDPGDHELVRRLALTLLGKSPESIAKLELADRFVHDPDRRAQAIKTRTEDVRRKVRGCWWYLDDGDPSDFLRVPVSR